MNRKLIVYCILIVVISVGFIGCIEVESNNENIDEYFTSEMLLESAILGGNYLINATIDEGDYEGIFHYIYDASQDEVDYEDYNILRHAGTIYSMLQLYNITKNTLLLDKAQKAIDKLLEREIPYNNASCIEYNDKIKLGGNALAIIALAEYSKATGDDKYLINMQNLAEYIKQSQKNSGEFISKRYYSTGKISDFVSEYYPGEALLALCRLYSLDKNETWLDVAEKGARYLILVRDGDVPTYSLIHDHWLLMSLNELYRYRSDGLYFNQSMRIAESIIHAQKDGVTTKTVDPNWIGSYHTARGTPTATRSEGLIAAYHLADDFGNSTMKDKVLRSIKLGIKFQLQLQFTKEDVVEFPNPDQALGGFRDSFTRYNIRIDYVQHNICSILGLYSILDEKN
jgi:uncharacterized protein YyaL (SSP411 family)